MGWTAKPQANRQSVARWVGAFILLGFVMSTAEMKPENFPNAPSFPEPDWDRWDTLFVIAATGEPRWQALRDSCEKELLKQADSTIGILLARRLVDQTPRQRRYVERLFGLMSDSGRNQAPGQALRTAMDRVDDSVKAQLLYVASTMADTSLLDLGNRFMSHEKADIRRMAARVLGMLRHPTSPKSLLSGLRGFEEKERHQRAWALAELAPFPGCERLKDMAGDSSLAVRQMISHALSRCAQGQISKLDLKIPRLNECDFLPVTPWLTFVDAAKEIGTPESLAFAKSVLMNLPEDTRRFYQFDAAK